MTGVFSLLPEGRPGLLLPHSEAGPGAGPSGTGPGEDLARYLAQGGYAPLPDPEVLLDRVAVAGLRGRGGAGFPAAVKLRAVRDAPGHSVVVANGEEGEPGSVKDRWLLRHRPHLVLDGLRLAAAMTGAARGWVYLSDDHAERAVRRALAERPAEPTAEPTAEPAVDVVRTEHTYVAGEESAVVRRVDGGPALPTAKPPRPFESGVGGAPTLVANVETLARIALIHSRPDAAAAVAAGHLVTLSGHGGADGATALVEVPAGARLKVLADLAGHGAAEAVLLGGMFGGLHGDGWPDLPLDHDGLHAAGTALGCGALHFLHPGDCPVAVATEAAAYLAAQSARQCGVCVSGTGALATTLAAVARGATDDDPVGRLRRWSGQLPGRGACGLLDAAARVVATLLDRLPHRVDAHRDGACPECAHPAPEDGRRFRVPVP
ncbi:NADH-ubiquinone oxidoreductase-F iron-sulfur binding region domain-containing protein [Streptomyces collinus]|uniref:NADH-ubiquinone oxidoreductase-F iron-sulfur binding region domain-containing protein n=1 Tax=Streptomyces collinus TaxID=42684 RepID=UPI0036E377AD